MYHSSKQIIVDLVLGFKKRAVEYNLRRTAIAQIKAIIKNMTVSCPKLSKNEVNAVKVFFRSKGYKLNNTYWHRYYSVMNGAFHVDYIPEDIFRAMIGPRMNQMRQWPALLDKNLSYILFKEFLQPKRVLQNINGFYYVDESIVNEVEAIELCHNSKKRLVIKPTIDSGQGKRVETFTVNENGKSLDKQNIAALFRSYKKDFIVQEFVDQSLTMKKLNPTTLNTLRIMTYLREDGVHILSAVSRIGKPESKTDNFTTGGIICGIDENGCLKKIAYSKTGEKFSKTYSGITVEGYKIPNYNLALDMVRAMHKRVPYFKIISWDIGINTNDEPLLVEYNTHYQSTKIHQIPNGPLFGKFTDEILAKGVEPYQVYL
ncbi:sugar-transfer associated ATP-grasp domain-containing protein [Muricauda sp. ANG21]|uniref:sugar-transfer associated ATP-grasp domain-containing protein n=1 Tax=Allomuricauda sp. ANG21 TaxID=3042468 RepID=UPI0034551CA2